MMFIRFTGFRARVAEVFNRVRPLTLDMICGLSAGLTIPADVLIRDYRLKRAALRMLPSIQVRWRGLHGSKILTV